MSILHRQDSAFFVAADGDIAPLADGTVTVYDYGAVASGASADTTIPVYAGHGVAVNDCIMVGIDETTFRLVTVSAATQLTVNASVSVINGDVIVNLGTDSAGGSGTPNYDGSTVEIYSVPDDANPIVLPEVSAVTIDADGNYGYYFNSTDTLWELVRDSTGVSLATVIRDSPVLLASSGTPFVDNSIARFDGTTGLIIQGAYTSNTPTISDAGAVALPGTVATGALTVTGAATVSTTLGVTGISTFADKIVPSADATKDIGTDATGRWRNLYLSGVASVGGALSALSTLTVTGLTTLANVVCGPHLSASVGSGPSTVSNIGNNWGSTSQATFAAGSTDTRFTVTVTTSGSTFANPATLAIPFAAAYSSAPFAVVAMNSSGTGTTANISWSTTTTTLTIIYKAVPVTANTYIFSVIVLG